MFGKGLLLFLFVTKDELTRKAGILMQFHQTQYSCVGLQDSQFPADRKGGAATSKTSL